MILRHPGLELEDQKYNPEFNDMGNFISFRRSGK